MPKEIIKSMNADMKKAVDHTLANSFLSTDKATPTMLDGIRVNAYGSIVSLKEVAAVTTPDARAIMVQPWDKSVIKDVEKGIQEANLGLTHYRWRHPPCACAELTGERRQELAKTASNMAERTMFASAKVVDALDLLRSAKNDDSLPEDDFKRHEKEVQKAHDDYISEINQHLTHKEAELKKSDPVNRKQKAEPSIL